MLLSNAFAVDLEEDLEEVVSWGPRSKDLLFVGRLLPWKAPILALRSLRYVRDQDAVLRFFGEPSAGAPSRVMRRGLVVRRR